MHRGGLRKILRLQENVQGAHENSYRGKALPLHRLRKKVCLVQFAVEALANPQQGDAVLV